MGMRRTRPNRNPAFENNRPDRLLARAHPGQLLVATSRQAHIGYTPCLYRPNREPNRKNANTTKRSQNRLHGTFTVVNKNIDRERTHGSKKATD